MVSHIIWSSSEASINPHPLQHISGGFYDARTRELEVAPSALGVVISHTSGLPMTLMATQERKTN